MRDKKVSAYLFPYVAMVLDRDKIEYTIHEETTDGKYISVGCSNQRFTEVIEDAECEEQRKRSLANIPVFSLRTIKNPKKFESLGGRGTCFQILDRDAEKVPQAMGW